MYLFTYFYKKIIIWKCFLFSLYSECMVDIEDLCWELSSIFIFNGGRHMQNVYLKLIHAQLKCQVPSLWKGQCCFFFFFWFILLHIFCQNAASHICCCCPQISPTSTCRIWFYIIFSEFITPSLTIAKSDIIVKMSNMEDVKCSRCVFLKQQISTDTETQTFAL